ncbi:MAG TPA: HD domain-containing protein [Anaerolineales bacterium]|nr:HD domain-containing protein [Anaerolineales bacterium]
MNQSPDSVTFTVPARHNPRLQTLVERINADEELRQLWRCANINAVDRFGMSDHGEVHIRIVANAALRLLRLLRDSGHPASVVTHYRLTHEDAEVVVVLAAALHDLGITIHYDNHTHFSLPLANLKAKELLTGLYPIREQTIIISEMLHAVAAHHGGVRCLTLEAGALKLADALDITAGRSRPVAAITPAPGMNADAVVDEVTIKKGENKPVRVEIRMSRPAGLHQVEDSLQQRLQHSPLFGLVEVVVWIDGESGERLMPIYAYGNCIGGQDAR